MRFRRFTDYLLSHRWLALAMTFAATLIGTQINQFENNAPLSIVFLGYLVGLTLCTFSVAAAALITLQEGLYWGLLFTFAATIPYISILLVNSMGEDNLARWIGASVAISGNLFTWIFAAMFYKKMNWRQVIQIGALIAVLMISILHLVMPTINDWWGQQLLLLQSAMLKGNPKAHGLSNTDVDVSKQFVNGMIAVFVLLSAISQLMLAKWWQSTTLNKNLRQELHSIRLSPLAGTLFIFSLLFAYLGNSVVLDMMPVLYVLFGIAGFSLVHYLFKQLVSTKGWFWLCVLYLAFFFLQPISIMLIAMLALIDTWFDVRKRFNKFERN